MTIGECLVIYERNHVAFLKTRQGTSRRLQRFVGQLAAIELGDLKRIQVIDWHRAIGETNGIHAANHAVQLLHSLYVKAGDWELYDGKNPAARIKKFQRQSRERFVQSVEMPWLLRSMGEELPQVEAFFLTLLFTGARRDEARTMRWTDLDFDRALWHKPTTKTGKPHTVPVPAILVPRLQQLPRVNEWVFPSTPNSKNGFVAGQWCITSVEHYWRRIRRRAGLGDVRIHDLRRTAASWLAISGANLPVIQQMLNHRSLTSTQIYARLSIAPVRQALDGQAEQMLNPRPNTVPLTAATQPPSLSDETEWPG